MCIRDSIDYFWFKPAHRRRDNETHFIMCKKVYVYASLFWEATVIGWSACGGAVQTGLKLHNLKLYKNANPDSSTKIMKKWWCFDIS